MGIEYETYILLTFSKSVCAANDSLLIGSRFDNADLRKEVCRLGFTGKIVAVLPPPKIIANPNNKSSKKDKIDVALQSLKIYKPKQREGYVDKFIDGYTGIGTNMFQKGTDISLFIGLKVELETKFHEVGTISASFGD